MKIYRRKWCLIFGIAFVAGCPSGDIGVDTDPSIEIREQILTLSPSESMSRDRFGASIAISGSTAIVKACRSDQEPPNDPWCESGSVLLFDTTTGGQIAELLPDEGAAWSWWWEGSSVAMSGASAIVGVSRLQQLGAAYVFDTTTGVQITELLPDDGAAPSGGDFGDSVAISGTTAIVGASTADNGGRRFVGAAYLFETTTGRQLSKLVDDDGARGDSFGSSVSISGTTAIVGAAFDDDACPEDRYCDSGSAYLFDTTTGEQIAKLLPGDGAKFDRFGCSVAIDGNIAVVGAVGKDAETYSFSFAGAAYVFDAATGQQVFKLVPADREMTGAFGGSVAISGNIIIVGADLGSPHNPFSAGSAYLFDATTGDQIAKLMPKDGAEGDFFGRSVAISGNTALVGAPFDDDACPENPDCDSGSAYIFDATRR